MNRTLAEQRSGRTVATLVTLLGALTIASCNGSAARPPGVEEMDARPPADAGGNAEEIRCTPGATRTCKVQLPSHNGVNSCFVGVAICIVGEWSVCMSPEEIEDYEELGHDAGADSGG